MDIALASPEGHGPDPAVLARTQHLAEKSGAVVEIVHDPAAAVKGAHAVYTDTWLAMDAPESERAERWARLRPFQVNEDLLARASPGAIFMHCLPAHRGDEVTPEVIDGPRSVVFDQVENRGHTEQAVLIALLERQLRGAG